jgi:enoyl-CoA hydratase
MNRTRHQDGVTILELGHGKANALDVDLCRGGIFSAGVDLLRLLDGGPRYIDEFLPAFHEMLETLFVYPKPVVAALNGHAIAGGCVVACATDHRVMAGDSGRVGVPELRVGVPFPSAALEIMRFALAPVHFREIMYRGAVLDPSRARDWGLIDEIVAAERLMDHAVASAADLASVSPSAFALTKTQIRAPFVERMKAAREGFDAAVRDIWVAPQTREAIRDYVTRTLGRGRS